MPNIAKKAGSNALFKASGSSFNTMVDNETQTDPVKFESQKTKRKPTVIQKKNTNV